MIKRQLRDVNRSKLLRDKYLQNKHMPGFLYLFDRDLLQNSWIYVYKFQPFIIILSQ